MDGYQQRVQERVQHDGSTFWVREQHFAAHLCDRTLHLSLDNLADEGTPIYDLLPTKLVNAAYASRREQDLCADNKVYVLIRPTLVHLKTHNAFWGYLRPVFWAVAPKAWFPYSQVENFGY